ncbi:RDD family protein [Pleionea sp. CnH1-48]|uniref:RDD family protein n=1 Tax=Pleionea sp. CnH1-48 TaxID=2954494 RepID=UPI002098556C|nr:RDD family protein [Pleionea sp. CnH1-48]MCO7223213.1 RDD family protein [Pleionea sp. CnH1-48]
MNENVYAAPSANLVEENEIRNALASRWARLGASLLDTVIVFALHVLFIYLTGIITDQLEGMSNGAQPDLTYTILVSLVGFAIYFLVNGYLLHKNGQTVGKKALGIKIVKLDGRKASFMELLAKRYSLYFLPGSIPVVGPIFSLVNVLFIFGGQRRCIHDYVAGTKVVDCNVELEDGQQEPAVSHPSLVPVSDVEYEVTDDVNENIRRFKEAQKMKYEQGG